MLTAKTVNVTSSASVKLTNGINMDQPLTLVIRVRPMSNGQWSVYVGDVSVGPGSGFRLTAGSDTYGVPLNLQNSSITVQVDGDDVYATTDSNDTIPVDVLAYSAC